MLTPIEIQSKNFKSGIGYDRKDVDAFMREVLAGYEKLYKENVEIKDKFTVLNERLQYYKTIEKTLQKALLLAEQTAEETKQTALRNAKAIEKEAHNKADMIIADAKNELNHVNQMITRLTQQYESYKVQYKQLANAQIELIKSPTFELTLMNGDTLNTSYTNPIDASKLELNVERNPDTEDVFASKDKEHKEPKEHAIKKAPLEKEDLEYLKEHANEFFQEENLQESFQNESEHKNKQSSTVNSNTVLNMDDFTMVEEETTLEGASEKTTNSKTLESDFDFIDFEVNLD